MRTRWAKGVREVTSSGAVKRTLRAWKYSANWRAVVLSNRTVAGGALEIAKSLRVAGGLDLGQQTFRRPRFEATRRNWPRVVGAVKVKKVGVGMIENPE